MTTIATLAVKLLADAQGFLATMDQAENKTKSWSQNVSKNLKEAGGKITDFGKGMTTYVTMPIIGAGVAAVKFASDLEETKNKAKVVFGEMSDSVLKYSQKSATELGISRKKYLDYASSIGAALTAGGMGVQESAALSEQAVKHFADLASFHNANVDDVALSWQSAIRGQYEPIQKYFPFINDSYIKTYGIAQGLIDATTENLTANQRAIILNAIALDENLNPAINDFAETSNGLANQQRILTAQLEDAAGALGLQLLPYVLQFVQWVSGLLTKFQSLSPEQQKWILIILGTVAVLGPLLMIIGTLITAIGAIIPVVTAVGGALMGPLGIALLLIAGLIYLLYLAWTNNWGGIQEKTQAAINFVKSIISAGMQFIQDLTSGKLGWLSQMWRNTMDAIGAIIENALAIWRHIKQAWRNLENGNWYMFGVELRKIWDLIMRSLGELIKAGWENLKLIWDNAIKKLWGKIKNIDWAEVGKSIIQGIINGLFWKAVELDQALRRIGQHIKDAFKGFFGIHSPSAVMKQEVGWELGAGTVAGFEESVRKLLMPSIDSTMQFPSASSMPGLGSVGTAPQPVVVMVDYHPLISTADENEAKFVLAPMIEDEVRKRERKE